MELPKILILLCCAYYVLASHEGHHTIPVEHYETELHDLGQHVEIPETPVKIVKITKTVAVKVPVPYPVKVIEKVPYPVHVSKPYPVPVPHIVKVPHVESPKTLHGHEALGSGNGQHFSGRQENYQVQEIHSHDAPSSGNSYDSFNEGDWKGYSQKLTPYGDDYSSEGSQAPSHGYYGNSDNKDAAFETKSYGDGVNNYKSFENSDHSLQDYNYH